jgi:hypothetical protein
MAYDEDMNSTPSDTPILDQQCFRRYPIDSIEEEPLFEHGVGAQGHPSVKVNCNIPRNISEQSLVTPPGSEDSESEDDDKQRGSLEPTTIPMMSSHNGIKQLIPLDIHSAQRHSKGSESVWSESLAGNEGGLDETMLFKASPTTTTAFEIRQQANRTLPENSLRCVGLNTELEAGHQPWLLKLIKILFYHDKVKEEAILSGSGYAYCNSYLRRYNCHIVPSLVINTHPSPIVNLL